MAQQLDMYFASYGHRYGGDPIATFVGLTHEAAEGALERGMEYEREELPGYCEIEHDDDDDKNRCTFCNPDIVSYGVWWERNPVKSGFVRDLAELRSIARELLDSNRYGFGHVVALER